MTEKVAVIDLGGTKIAGALADPDGRLHDQQRVYTPSQEGPEAVVAAVAGLVQDLQATGTAGGADIVGVGIGSARVVDAAGRNIIAATDAIKDWAGTPLTKRVEAATGLPVTLENDVNAHLRGETWKGTGVGKMNLAMMALGTGIGGAVMMDGEIMVGPRGTIGDFGHLPTFLATKHACTCRRQVPHLEAVASGPGLVAWYHEKGGDNAVTGAKALEKMTESEDPLALETYREAGRETGRALGTIVGIFDPELVIIGGGLGNSGELWWGALHEAYREQLVDALREVPVVKAQLGNQTALVGAAEKIWDYLGNLEQG